LLFFDGKLSHDVLEKEKSIIIFRSLGNFLCPLVPSVCGLNVKARCHWGDSLILLGLK